jgi:hypothetical protein
MKLGLLAASLVLVAGGAAGCGGDDSSDGGGGGGAADKGVSQDDFCGAFQAFYDDLQGITGTEDNLGEILKKAAQRIEDVGTPDDISDDAKDGLQLTLDAIDALPDDATSEDMAALDADFSDADQKQVDAFSDYLDKTCPDIGDSSSDSESESGDVPSSDSSSNG